jgi:hypothetical protein
MTLLGGNFFGLIAPGILLFTGVPAIIYRLR